MAPDYYESDESLYTTMKKGCTKKVFLINGLNWVIKIPLSGQDSCKQEEIIFAKAQKEKLDKYFAGIYLYSADFLEMKNVYIQRKYPCDEDRTGDALKDYVRNKYSDLDFNTLENIDDFFEEEIAKLDRGELIEAIWGERNKRLQDFLILNNIDDIHGLNIGYNEEDEPILIDYEPNSSAWKGD